MRKLLLILLFIPGFSFGQRTDLTIEVFLKGMPDSTFFYLNEDNVNLDSSFSTHERLHFTYHKTALLPAPLLIISKDRRQGYVFYIENTAIKLQGIYKDLTPLLTNNSKTQNEFREHELLTSKLSDSVSVTANKFQFSRYSHDPDSIIYKERLSHISLLLKQVNIGFIKKYPGSIISTQTLFFEAQHHRFSNEEVLSSFKELSLEQQNSTLGQGIVRSVLLFKNPIIGEQAPGFTMNDPRGDPVSLTDFKGKNIVLLFWASWCMPCLQEMPEIIKFYEKNKNADLVFIAVSLDEKKDPWLTAIQKYSAPFINLSDLKGSMNEAALIYGVSAVPENFLIGIDGQLISREHGFGRIKKSIVELIK